MKKKNLLITGCTGMIGLSLLQRLTKEQNYNISVIYKNKSSLNKIKVKSSYIKFIKLDLKNIKLTNKIKNTEKYYAVIHMASSRVGSQLNLKTHLEENFKIAINLLNFIKNRKVQHFIFTNSAAIYKPGFNLKENSSKSNNPYGLSKYLTSNLIKNFCLAERIYFKDLRIFSVFGEWEKTDRLVAGAIDSAINKKFFFIKTVNQFRDYLHTDDVVSAIIKSIKVKKTIALNICSGKKISTHKLVIKIFDKLSSRNLVKFKLNRYDKNKHIVLSKMTGNNILAKKILDWEPKNGIDDGINLIIKRKYRLK